MNALVIAETDCRRQQLDPQPDVACVVVQSNQVKLHLCDGWLQVDMQRWIGIVVQCVPAGLGAMGLLTVIGQQAGLLLLTSRRQMLERYINITVKPNQTSSNQALFWKCLANMYSNKFETKWYQNRPSLLNSIFIIAYETCDAYTCHNQRQLRHVSLNIIIIVSIIQTKHHIK